MSTHKPKVVFAASSGGHFEQLMMLYPLMEQYDSFILTEKVNYSIKTNNIKVHYLNQINRKEISFLPNLLWNSIKSLIVLLKEKPDFIISTGALATIPVCIVGKIFKKKIIYIESFAKINTPTMTGKFLYAFADQFYVQWEEMLDIFPEAIYKGSIY